MRMKFTVLILAFPIFMLAQEKEKCKYGLDLGTSYTRIESSERVEFQLGFNVEHNGSIFRLAPIVQTYSSEAKNDPNNWKLTGVGVGYFRDIETKSPRLSLTFRIESTLQQYSNTWGGTFFDTQKQEYVGYRYESNELFSANTIGYGFTYNCSKKFYLRTLVAGGVYFSNVKGEREHTPVPTNVRVDFRGYDDFGFVWKSTLSIGYTF